MGCLIFISNVKAQMGNDYWRFRFEYNADMTASVRIWNDTIDWLGHQVTEGNGVNPYFASDYNSNHVYIPDHVIYNGQNYTVTAIKRGATNLGWRTTGNGTAAQPYVICDTMFFFYIPKTIQSIEDSVFCGRGARNIAYSDPITGIFNFYFEGFAYDDYYGIMGKFGNKWATRGGYYGYFTFGGWNVVRFYDNQDLTIDADKDTSSGQVSVMLDNNTVTDVTPLNTWIRVTTNNFRSSVSYDTNFTLSYSLDANTGAARSGNIVLTDNNNQTKTITINQAAGSNTDTKYTLTVNNGSGTGSYTAGTVVNITANTAPSGQTFDSWTGDIANLANANSANTTFTMSSVNATITATYKDIPPVTYTIKASASENGNISPSGDVSVISGNNQTFTFNPDNGYVVDKLTVDGTNVSFSGNSYTFTNVQANHTINATFKIITYTLIVNSGSGGGNYAPGNVVNIAANTAPSGQTFDSWTGDVSGVSDINNANTTYTMGNSDATITATYRDTKTGIKNVNVSNVKYRIDNGIIYFDAAVNNIQLYDLSGKLLYANKYGTQLNVWNNLKGVYLLKYDNTSVKVRL